MSALSLPGCDAYLGKEMKSFNGIPAFTTTPTVTWGEGQL